MAFKMKGPSLYPKTRLSQKLNVDHSAKTSTSEGRASSSAFQMKDGKTKEELLKEGFTPKDADQMRKDGATTGKQKPKKTKKPSQGDFEPAYPGADISEAEYNKRINRRLLYTKSI